jgi:hypothetical protein
MGRELRDSHDGAQDERSVEDYFENSPAFFFRANQESVSGFELVFHRSDLVAILLCNHHANRSGSNVTASSLGVYDSFHL